MGSAPIRASTAVGRFLRMKRRELGLTMREVYERLSEKGDGIPNSTLVRIEQGKLDPGVRRLHMLLDLYRVPPHLVADLVEMETLAAEPPPESDLETLYQEGLRHWKDGNIGDGLSYLFAVRQRVAGDEASRRLRQKAMLAFATAARNLGKMRLARQIVDDLLCEPPDPSVTVDVLVLASSLWRHLGSPEMALATVRQAETHMRSADDRQKAWILHQKAKLLVEAGRPEEAQRCLARALSLYRTLEDTYNEGRALALRMEVLERLGGVERALTQARRMIAFSERHGHRRLVAVGHLELGRLQMKAGRTEKGLASLHLGLGQAVMLQDREAEFLAHYRLWKAYEALGDGTRAELEAKAAHYFAGQIDDRSPEAEEARRIVAKPSGPVSTPRRPVVV